MTANAKLIEDLRDLIAKHEREIKQPYNPWENMPDAVKKWPEAWWGVSSFGQGVYFKQELRHDDVGDLMFCVLPGGCIKDRNYDGSLNADYRNSIQKRPAELDPKPTVRDQLMKLPDGVREAALENAERSNRATFLADECDSMSRALYDAFLWQKTPQGYEYWWSVWDSPRSGQPIPPLPEPEDTRPIPDENTPMGAPVEVWSDGQLGKRREALYIGFESDDPEHQHYCRYPRPDLPNGWTTGWFKHARIIEQEDPNAIDWSKVPKKWNAAAVDASGKRFLYERKPKQKSSADWWDGGDYIFDPYYTGTGEGWEDSLQLRPGYEGGE